MSADDASPSPSSSTVMNPDKSAPGGNRTPDLDVRTVLLYPLSYEGVARPGEFTQETTLSPTLPR